MPVIEFGLMGVKPSRDVVDPTMSSGAILHKAWSSVTSAPGGPHWAFVGPEVDNSLYLWGFFEFDSVRHHEEFAKTLGKEAFKDLPIILTHSVFMKHVLVEGDMPAVLKAPVTAVTLVYLPSDISQARKEKVSTLVGPFVHEKLDTCADVTGASFGWSVEDELPVFGREGGDEDTGTVFAVFVGWSSVDALKAFREANGDRGVFGKIGEMEKVTHSVTRLIQCREFGSSKG